MCEKYFSIDHALAELRYELSANAFRLAALRLELALKAGFNPEQPRVPAGQPGGGQWTDGDEAPVINDPPIEEVYPEFLILPFLRIPKLLNAWRLWAQSRRESRDWTPEEITNTIKYGKRFRALNKPRMELDPRATATRYEYNGRYVVRDDQTGEILQVSGPNHTPSKFP